MTRDAGSEALGCSGRIAEKIDIARRLVAIPLPAQSFPLQLRSTSRDGNGEDGLLRQQGFLYRVACPLSTHERNHRVGFSNEESPHFLKSLIERLQNHAEVALRAAHLSVRNRSNPLSRITAEINTRGLRRSAYRSVQCLPAVENQIQVVTDQGITQGGRDALGAVDLRLGERGNPPTAMAALEQDALSCHRIVVPSAHRIKRPEPNVPHYLPQTVGIDAAIGARIFRPPGLTLSLQRSAPLFRGADKSLPP